MTKKRRARSRRKTPDPRSLKSRRVTASEAVELHQELITWLTSNHTPDVLWEGALRDSLSYGESRALSHGLARELKTVDPIWCHHELGQLLAVATDALPPEQHNAPLLLPSHGAIYFAEPLPAEWRTPTAPLVSSLSALTWFTPPTSAKHPTSTWVIGWERKHPELAALRDGRPAWLATLRPNSAIEHWLPGLVTRGDITYDHESPMLALLHAFAALIRTPTTREETQAPSARTTTSARRHGTPEPMIRRIYLRQPEQGPAELDALRAERHGTPRGHWVRGHWRNQWYASVEEHRWVWIEGHPRGDWTKGHLRTPKVLIARD